MWKCPSCGCSLSVGQPHCTFCGAKRSAELKPGQAVDPSGSMALLMVTPDTQWAHVIEVRLTSCGIPCRVKSESGTESELNYPDTVIKESSLFVPEPMLAEANRILRWELAAT